MYLSPVAIIIASHTSACMRLLFRALGQQPLLPPLLLPLPFLLPLLRLEPPPVLQEQLLPVGLLQLSLLPPEGPPGVVPQPQQP
jgi:hypothetical protein